MIEGNGVRTLKIKKLSLAVCLAFLPLSSNAAGLGKLTVTSNLGEPFKGVIELLETSPEEMETLVAVIASEEAYAAQGITRLGIHNDIKVEIVDAKSATPKLKLTSIQAVTEPYIDMLIQLDWAAGRLQREYTVLLDPPGYKQALKNEEIAEIKSPDSATETAKPESTPNKQPSTAQVGAPDVDDQLKAMQEAPKPVRAKPTQRRTKSGDNLSKIAQTMRLDGVSLDQMLVALYENNKDAFVGENMNRLKVGKVIKLPSKETILATSRADANKTVQLHVSDWQAYRTGLASAVPETKTPEPTPTPSQTDSGKVVAAEKSTKLTGQAEAQDVVKLSAGEKDKASKDPKKAEEAKKTAAQEDKAAHDKALAEAQGRTAAVEKQIEDMQKLLAMKNKAMTDLQKKAEADLAAQKQAETAKPETTVAEAKPVDPVAQETPKVETPADSAQAEVTPPAVEEPPKVEPAKEEPKVAAQPPVVKAPEPVVEAPSFIASLLESINLPLIAGVGGIGLLAAGWMYLRNKRRKDLESFERGILTSGGLKANTVFGNTTGSTSSTDTSFLTDFAQSTDGAMMDTHDVDPIAEAEVYMAYGRDAQAEEILKDAITKEPKRYELHLKLLEMYAGRKDTSAFEAIAGELYTTLGSDDPNWEKVATLGRELEPDNPLYAAKTAVKETAESVAADVPVATEKVVEVNEEPVNLAEAPSTLKFEEEFATPEAEALTFTTEDAQAEAPEILDAPSIELVASAPEVEMSKLEDEPIASFETALNTFNSEVASDLSAAKDAVKSDIQSAADKFDVEDAEEISLDTDLSLTTDSGMEVTQSEMSVDDLDFDLSTEDTSAPQTAESNLKSIDLSNISLDLNGPPTELTIEAPEEAPVAATAGGAANNDVEVKLNLVAAYIDMDDKEGARELLEEVLKEGNEEQVVKAQMMLDSLA